MRLLRAIVIWVSLFILIFTGWMIWSKNAQAKDGFWFAYCDSLNSAKNAVDQAVSVVPTYIAGCFGTPGPIKVPDEARIVYGPLRDQDGDLVSAMVVSYISAGKVQHYYIIVVELSHMEDI